MWAQLGQSYALFCDSMIFLTFLVKSILFDVIGTSLEVFKQHPDIMHTSPTHYQSRFDVIQPLRTLPFTIKHYANATRHQQIQQLNRTNRNGIPESTTCGIIEAFLKVLNRYPNIMHISNMHYQSPFEVILSCPALPFTIRHYADAKGDQQIRQLNRTNRKRVS